MYSIYHNNKKTKVFLHQSRPPPPSQPPKRDSECKLAVGESLQITEKSQAQQGRQKKNKTKSNNKKKTR